MDELTLRNLDTEETQPISALPSRTRCGDLASVIVADLAPRSSYTSNFEESETSMPDMPPFRVKQHRAEPLPDIGDDAGEATTDADPPNTGFDEADLPQSNHVVAEQPQRGSLFDQVPRRDSGIKKVTPSDMANALLAQNDFAVYQEQLYLYSAEEGCWLLLPESDANRRLRGIIPDDFADIVNKNVLSEIYEWLRIRAEEVDEQAGQNQYLLNFLDCAIDWRTQEIVPNRKEKFFRYALQVRFCDLPDKSTGAYKRFLDDVFGKDKKTRKAFSMFMGLCLNDIRTLKLCFFLYGPSNTGKSVVLNLLKRLVGAGWCSSLSFTQMSCEFALTQLLGKRLNLSGEVSGASNKRLDIFKSLTGNDTSSACYKGKDYFQFSNEAMLVFACNDFPPIQAVTEFDSFLSRIIIFPFENVKPRNEWIDNLEDILFADAGAIISDAIDGLNALKECGFHIQETSAMKAARQEFIGRYNSFALFADAHLEKDTDSVTTSKEIGDKYHTFCREEGLEVLPDNLWPTLLVRELSCRKTTKTVESFNNTSTRVRAYKGIRLIEPDHYLVERR